MSANTSCRRLAVPLWHQLAQLGAATLRSSHSSSAGASRSHLSSLRQLSSQAELPSLKHALRAIYKKVHPDLFQDYRPAKEANTRSFKMLQEYLEAARTGPKVPLPYRFHFFIRTAAAAHQGAAHAAGTGSSSNGSGSGGSSSSTSSTTTASASSSSSRGSGGGSSGAAGADPSLPPFSAAPGPAGPPPGLHEVTLTLPPPTRGAPGEEMSGSTRKAFGRLLGALGLPSSFALGEEREQDAAARERSRFVSLREFLPQAVEAVHQNAAAQSSAQHQLAALRTALRLGRRVTAGFGGPAAAAGALVQLQQLQRLVAALDSLGGARDLSGLKVTVGQASGVDALGTVWLAADGTQDAWARHLAGVDAAHCRERQQLLAAVRAQEAAVAAALGLAMVYTQQEASMASDYRQALERLAAAAAQRGPVEGGRYRDLPVMLQPAAVAAAAAEAEAGAGASAGGSSSGSSGGGSSGGGSSSAGSSSTAGCRADVSAGLLLAPTAVSAEELYEAVQRLGPQVLAALRRRRQAEAELAALRTQVERKVMLRRLLRDPSVSDAHFKSCLDRMLAHAQKLSGLLHGQAVRVAQVNGLSPDRAVIDLAWDWRM